MANFGLSDCFRNYRTCTVSPGFAPEMDLGGSNDPRHTR